MGKSNLFLFVTLICSFGCTIFAEDSVLDTYPVPAMLWRNSDDGPVSKQLIPAMVIHNSDEFRGMVAEETNDFQDQTVVIIRDNLCTEDFKCRQGDDTCHPFLSKIKNRRYVPAIQNAYKALRESNQTQLNAYVETTGELSEKIEDERITYVDMGSKFHDETVEEYNVRMDRLTEDIVKKCQDKHPLFILMGRYCDPHRVSVSSRKRRDVSAPAAQRAQTATAQNTPALKNQNLLVYFTELLVYKKGQTVNLNTSVTTLSVTDVTSSSLKAQLKSTTEPLTVTFEVNDFGSTWYVQTITVNDAAGISNKYISAPLGFSYKCTPVVNISVTGDGEVVAVGIRGIQLQPKFGDVSDAPLNRFGDANDCTGFTSIGIWSGLIVSFLLLGILTMGLSWILDIRTMDRFDDPKGMCQFSKFSAYFPTPRTNSLFVIRCFISIFNFLHSFTGKTITVTATD